MRVGACHISGLLAKPTAAGSSTGAGSDFSARATINAEEEISLAISDGTGRSVISGIIENDTSGTPITWNITLHDTVANNAGFGDCLVTKSINVLVPAASLAATDPLCVRKRLKAILQRELIAIVVGVKPLGTKSRNFSLKQRPQTLSHSIEYSEVMC